MSSPTSTSQTSLSTTLTTGRSLILLQLTTRLLTFTLNQSLVRLAPPEVFGTAAIQFDLICSTILFLSREGIRNAVLRSQAPSNGLADLPLSLGITVTTAVLYLYGYTTPLTTRDQPGFLPAITLYVISSWLELAIEPLYIWSLRSNPPKIHVRLQAEGGMAIVKAVVTVIALLSLDKPLLGFAIGQVSGAGWLFGRYVWEYGWRDMGFLSVESYDRPTLYLAMTNTGQSFIKHLLTEGDRIAVGYLSPLSDQGGYAVAMNYGSLIARIIFQPLEETLLLHFTSPSTTPTNPSTIHLLTYILHLSSHLLLLPTFLPPLLPAILPLLLPRRYQLTTAPKTLQTYLIWYIPLMSLNGILESFHTATASAVEVKKQAGWMMGSSLVFVGGIYVLPRVGLGWSTEEVLIMGSCGAMVIRILYAYRHAEGYFSRPREEKGEARGGTAFGWRGIVPKRSVVISSLISGLILRYWEGTKRWEKSWKGWGELIGLGGFLGLGVLGVMWRAERGDLARLQRVLKGKIS